MVYAFQLIPRRALARLAGVLAVLCAALGTTLSSASADQTHAELPELFEKLRRASPEDAEMLAARITAIWSDSASDTVDLLYARAAMSVDAGDWILAGALLDHALGLAPSFAQGYALRAVVRLRDENPEGASEDLYRALELEPRHFEARIALAEMLIASQRKEEAYDELQRALTWNPHAERALNLARRLRRELDGQEI